MKMEVFKNGQQFNVDSVVLIYLNLIAGKD